MYAARCGNGGGAGQSGEASKTYRGRELPGVFPPEVRAQATALACSRPREEEVPLARWSNAEIARRLVALGMVVSIAASTVGRWLASDQIRPWRYRSWQHILDPQAILERARPVLRLYGRAKALLKKGSAVVIPHSSRTTLAEEYGKLHLIKQKQHGDTCISIYFREVDN